MATILPCGRIVTAIRVIDPIHNTAETCSLLVDTGAEVSIFPYLQLPLKHASHRCGGTQHILGLKIPTLLYMGVTIEVDIDRHGCGSNHKVQRCTAINATTKFPKFGNFDGILGVDLLDLLLADAVKNAGCVYAYLAERV